MLVHISLPWICHTSRVCVRSAVETVEGVPLGTPSVLSRLLRIHSGSYEATLPARPVKVIWTRGVNEGKQELL